MSGAAIFGKQLYATCKIRYLEKRRNLPVTFCEYFSHLVIVSLLLMGYSLSIVEYFPDTTYTQIDVPIPPLFVDASSSALSIDGIATTANNIMKGPLLVPTLQSYLAVSNTLSTLNDDNDNVVSTVLAQTAVGQIYGNLIFKGALHVAPAGPLADDLIDYLNSTTPALSNVALRVHASEDAAVRYILDNLQERALALIVLREVSIRKVNYVLRMNYTTLPNTNRVVKHFTLGLDAAYQSYFLSGFLSIQGAVDAWVADFLDRVTVVVTDAGSGNVTTVRHGNASGGACSGSTYAQPNTVVFAPMPTYAYDKNPFYTSVGFLLGLAMTMATMYPMSRLVKSVVEEKEARMREVMKVMGLHSTAHQLSWALTALIVFTWIAASTTWVCSSTFLPHTEPALLFGYFFVFCLSEVSLSFLLSTLFSNSKLAAIVAPVVLFCALLPRYIFFTTNTDEQFVPKVAASLLSPVAFAFGADYIADAEYIGVGVQSFNMRAGRFNFATCMQMMFFDAVLYLVLAWYLDLVLPQEFGTPLPWWFPFSPAYWGFGNLSAADGDRNGDGTRSCFGSVVDSADPMEVQPALEDGVSTTAESNEEPFSPAERDSVRAVIQHLSKRYDNGKLAVRNLSLSLVEGQITCLLGHNGAGKSTAVSILTGLLRATTGDVSIYGQNLASDLASIRQITGVCPQQNVIFPTLTVTEHLEYFGMLKGLVGKPLRDSVLGIVQEVGLVEKQNVQSQALSGGMKRKLCLAMALVGDAKFVLLDEPTSGMDPYSRRSTWEILERCKKGRIVVLTTHFMDEADTLGDRIAIMAHGRLRCAGTSLYLKNRFGVGYLLTVSMKQNDGETGDHANGANNGNNNRNGNRVDSGGGDGSSNVFELTRAVSRFVPGSAVSSMIAGEIVYQLSSADESTGKFPDLFTFLTKQAASLGVVSYALSVTTLEQVFIQLAREQHALQDAVQEAEDEEMFYDLAGWVQKRVIPNIVGGWEVVSTFCRTNVCKVAAEDGDSEAEAQAKVSAAEAQAKVSAAVHGANPSAEMVDIKTVYAAVGGGLRAGGYAGVSAGGPEESLPSAPGVDMVEQDVIVQSKITGADVEQVEPASSRGQALQGGEDGECAPSWLGVVGQFLWRLHPMYQFVDTSDGAVNPSSTSAPALAPASAIADKPKPTESIFQGIADSIVFIQLVELMRKRWIMAKRDVKGLFFQLIFPALQILAVLAILTVEVNRSGNTLKMNSVAFPETADSVIVVPPPLITTAFGDSGNSTSANNTLAATLLNIAGHSLTDLLDFGGTLEGANSAAEHLQQSPHMGTFTYSYNATGFSGPAAWVEPAVADSEKEVENSTQLSEMYLDQNRIYGASALNTTTWAVSDNRYRYGSFVFNDYVIINATVHWGWVKDLLNSTSTNSTNGTVSNNFILEFLLDSLGVDDNVYSFGPLSTSLSNLFQVNNSIGNQEVALNISNSAINDFVQTLVDAGIVGFGTLGADLTNVFNSTGGLATIYIPFLNQTVEFNVPAAAMNVTQAVVDTINQASNTTVNTTTFIGNANGFTILSVDGDPIEVQAQNSSMTFGRVLVDFAAREITLANVTVFLDLTVTFNNDTFSVPVTVDSPDIVVPFDDILDNLPDTEVEYRVPLGPVGCTVLHNSSSAHSAGIFQGELLQANFRMCSPAAALNNHADAAYVNAPEAAAAGEYSATVTYPTGEVSLAGYFTAPLQYLVKNHPLPITAQESLEIQVILALFTSLFILVPLCYIPASFVTFIVKERAVKSKHLQLVSSVSPYLYWWATYAWDMVLYMVLACLIILTLYSYGQQASGVFTGTPESAVAILLLLTVYGASVIPLSYMYSFAFTNHSTAQISIMTINFITGFVMVLAYFIMVNIPSTNAAAGVAVVYFRAFPPYNIGEGLINLSVNFYENNVLGLSVDALSWPVTGRNIVFMLYEAVGYFGLVLLSENTRLRRAMHEIDRWRLQYLIIGGVGETVNPMGAAVVVDEDVAAENRRVAATTDPNNAVLLINGLVKTYPPSIVCGGQPKRAVRGLSLSCAEGERFGLLGINGAGKTTSIDILTGDIEPTAGAVHIGGMDLSDPATRRLIGYCPQADPLLDLMTGRETLWFFGRIRGTNNKQTLDKESLTSRIDNLIEELGLGSYADKPCGTYSGGNKRKLSLAIALIGNPKLLLLDEPSTGMDPLARRKMWDVIEKVSLGRTVILTTHSMEECEALCTRVGIMVSGRLKCIGTCQHLKSRFGAGYQIEVRCAVGAADVHVQLQAPGNVAAVAHVDAPQLEEGHDREQEMSAEKKGHLQPAESSSEQAAGPAVEAVEATSPGAPNSPAYTVVQMPRANLVWSSCQSALPTLSLAERFDNYLRMRSSGEIDLAAAFALLLRLKADRHVLDFNVSQATLEQIFIGFAREQEEEGRRPGGLLETTPAPAVDNGSVAGASVTGTMAMQTRHNTEGDRGAAATAAVVEL